MAVLYNKIGAQMRYLRSIEVYNIDCYDLKSNNRYISRIIGLE